MKLNTNEIVFRGHPDKVCDQIAGALLNEYLKKDKINTRAGIEVVGGKGKIFITGEVTSDSIVDVTETAKQVLDRVGYDATKYEIIENIGEQSPDIAMGVDIGGAGDQGFAYGYATNETIEMLPLAQVILQRFAMAYDKLRIAFPQYFFSDGKAQITGYYDDDFRLVKIKTFLVSYQNCELYRENTDMLIKSMIKLICEEYGIEIEQILINPTGKFYIGGFDGDSGVTNRKIVVDTYQGFAKIGGGGLNGKDPTKVDFSAHHKAREIAKRLVLDRDLKWCEVQLSYAIGKELPLAIYAKSDRGDEKISKSLYKECTPKAMIEDSGLRDLDFEKLAQFGHFVD